MPKYLFHIELGNFIGLPDDSIHSYDVEQRFTILIEAESLSKANKVIEQRFGNYTRCRYKYDGNTTEGIQPN